MVKDRVHGGPDARGPARFDFSTCANAAGPCPEVVAALREVDATRYPDPRSTAVREALAQLHQVESSRILPVGSASEFIQRVTAVGTLLAPGPVAVPRHAYGDYATAAHAWRRPLTHLDDPTATLRWYAEPSSPLGQDTVPPDDPGTLPTVLDAVYAPLRLAGKPRWTGAARRRAFVLHSPNKALGLTGLRGAYVVLPAESAYDLAAWHDALHASAPSWPLSAQADEMLRRWARPTVQGWVAESRQRLGLWKDELGQALSARGFVVEPSATNFFCARTPVPDMALRDPDVAVRDTTSFGLPGHWRLSAQPPEAISALVAALETPR